MELQGCKDPGIPTDATNLLFRSVRSLITKHGIKKEIFLRVVNQVDVPVGKGLGSSATAVAAGLLAANKIYGLGLSIGELICRGLEIEPHPDNIAPCLAGGLVVCYENGCCSHEKITLQHDYRVMVLVPDHYVNTNEARKLIPKNIPLQDAIFNVSHFALLLRSLSQGDLDGAAVFIKDRMHQPYRRSAYEKSMEIVDLLNERYAVPSAISGSGPAVFSIMDKTRYEKYFPEIKITMQKRYPDFKILLTKINNQGSRIE